MENASKALIIAGAILISILLISVGIMIFNSSSGLFDSAKSSMSEQEVRMFNQKFSMYEGENVSGTEVRELFNAIKTNNANAENQQVKMNTKEIKTTSTIKIVATGRYTVTATTNNAGVITEMTVAGVAPTAAPTITP